MGGIDDVGQAVSANAQSGEPGWISLFDGESLEGWKPAEENPGTFSIRDGAIVAKGPRCHLFYVGPVEKADFRDFELKVDVKTEPGSNGGIYFHTAVAEEGLARQGVRGPGQQQLPVRPPQDRQPVQDAGHQGAARQRWRVVHHAHHRLGQAREREPSTARTSWTGPSLCRPNPPSDMRGRVLDHGTFALQGHDPRSTVYYRNIRVKPLPVLTDYHVHLQGRADARRGDPDGRAAADEVRHRGELRRRVPDHERCGPGAVPGEARRQARATGRCRPRDANG